MTERLSQNIWLRPALILAGSLCVAQAMIQASSVAFVIVGILVAVAGLAFLLLPPGGLFPLYFLYLILEGAIKILSNYNPILHVGSDLFLLAIFWRLYQRQKNDPNIAKLNDKHLGDLKILLVAFAIYWTWVAIQFINPVSLGILPSLAGLKLHLLPYLCFFIVCFYLEEKEVRRLAPWILGLVTCEAAFALFDWTQGVAFLGRMSSRYVFTYYNFLPGLPYRPFGTTSLPGAPSVWMAHGTVAFFLVWYFQKEKEKQSSKKYNQLAERWWWAVAFIPLALMTLIICQVRSVFMRTALLMLVGIALQGRRHLISVVFAVGAFVLWNQTLAPTRQLPNGVRQVTVAQRFEGALLRLKTLRSAETFKKARGGFWAVEEMGRRGSVTMAGIGLSRISAASALWVDRIKADPLFGEKWIFADNLFLALFTEIGLGGLIAHLGLMFTVIFLLMRKRSLPAKLIAFYALLILLGSYASEGILYQPEASLFWTYVGMGIRLGNTA